MAFTTRRTGSAFCPRTGSCSASASAGTAWPAPPRRACRPRPRGRGSRALLDAAFARELPEAQFPDFPAAGLVAFDGEPALAAYLAWRCEPVTSLLAEIREAAAGASRILLIDAEGTWWGGVDLPAAAREVDGLLHCAYFAPLDRIGPLLAAAREALGPDKTLIAGFQLFHPEVAGPADLAARVAAARRHVDGVNFYNLGLVPPSRLAWIGGALTQGRAG